MNASVIATAVIPVSAKLAGQKEKNGTCDKNSNSRGKDLKAVYNNK